MCKTNHNGYLLAIVFATLLLIDATSAQSKLQLYFFTNAHCGPCKVVEPELETLFREGYSIMKIDTSIHPDWTRRFQVTKTPTVVLMAGNKQVASHSGYIDANTLRGWFRSAEQQTTKAAPAQRRQTVAASGSQGLTTHKGTYRPGNKIEQLAMQATVRLKIEDPEGTSYATGTVIHSFEDEALVLTCGHVFRDSDGKGRISAEYGFLEQELKVANGELVFYDANARDIGLVAIKTDGNIKPVSVAKASRSITDTEGIFSIGCDQGDRPSIRRSKIIGRGKYDGVNKLEIYGRPVNGRSGGGLFTIDGQLVGVCNAAVVDEDEGVYVTLDTIHWQFDKVNLAHLFNPQDKRAAIANVVSNERSDRGMPKADLVVRQPRNFSAIPIRDAVASREQGNQLRANPVALKNSDADTELIIVMRRKGGTVAESWTVNDPSPGLVEQLKQMGGSQSTESQDKNRLAELRRDMPNLQPSSGKNYNRDQVRAQSPR